MTYRPIPEDFEAHKNDGMQRLMARYHAGAETVRRWKKMCGTYRPLARKIISTDENGNETVYNSVTAAAAANWGHPNSIYNALRRGGTAWGLKWRYDDSKLGGTE